MLYNVVNNGIVGNPDVLPGGENLVVNNIEQNNIYINIVSKFVIRIMLKFTKKHNTIKI